MLARDGTVRPFLQPHGNQQCAAHMYMYVVVNSLSPLATCAALKSRAPVAEPYRPTSTAPES
eukprot:6026329-Prymnesium_polylepis.1